MSVPITLWFAVLTDRMAKTPDRSVLSAALAAVSARRPAQAGAIKVTEHCAVIDESVCLSCGMCVVKCPRHVLTDLRGIIC